MADSDQALVGRCPDCGKLHAAIVVSPSTASAVSGSVDEMKQAGLSIEQMAVGKAREELALADCGGEVDGD